MNRLRIDQGKRLDTDLFFGLSDSRGKFPTVFFARDSTRRYVSDGVLNALLMYVEVNVVGIIMSALKLFLWMLVNVDSNEL